jgi:hypothetical protein
MPLQVRREGADMNPSHSQPQQQKWVMQHTYGRREREFDPPLNKVLLMKYQRRNASQIAAENLTLLQYGGN